jgi:LysR family transcriptional activator of nhaA
VILLPVAWLNYHHFFYFWTVAREGSVAKAARLLRLSEPTVSAQVRSLEETLGEQLFRREGRLLVLTEAGRLAQRYANDIFALGQEFQAAIEGLGVSKAARFVVGVADVVPRLIAFRLLEPALQPPKPFVVSCQTGTPDGLLAKLEAHQVDAVISDAPIDARGSLRTHNRLLGECDVTIFGSKEVAAELRGKFPKSLAGAPFLLPAEGTAMRCSLEKWFAAEGVRPEVSGEFTDSSLLKTFGRAGVGLFAAPSAIAREVSREFRVRAIGRIEAIKERFYVVSASRKTEHAAVAAISHSARHKLFG